MLSPEPDNNPDMSPISFNNDYMQPYTPNTKIFLTPEA